VTGKVRGKPRTTTASLARFRERLDDPVAHDPLEVLGRLFVRAAEQRDADLVANLDDNAFPLAPPSIDPADIGQAFGEWGEVRAMPGWVVVSPKDFGNTRLNRIDRAAAKRLFADVVQTDGLSLDDAAAYALDSTSPYILFEWDRFYADALESTDGRCGYTITSGANCPDALRLYASISPDLRNLMRKGEVRVGDLSPATQNRLTEDFYVHSFDDESHQSFEPTDVFPDRLPPSGLLRITNETNETAIVPVRRQGNEDVAGWRAGFSADWLGQALAANPQTLASYNRLRLGHVHRFELTAEYAPGITQAWTLRESVYLPGFVDGYDNLPSDFRAATEAMRAKRAAEIEQSGLGPAKPPPP
jgi:hypothetical protein